MNRIAINVKGGMKVPSSLESECTTAEARKGDVGLDALSCFFNSKGELCVLRRGHLFLKPCRSTSKLL